MMESTKSPCIVCMDAPVNTQLRPCRHQILCCGCAEVIVKRNFYCPVCRFPVDSFVSGDEIGNKSFNPALDLKDAMGELTFADKKLKDIQSMWLHEQMDQCISAIEEMKKDDPNGELSADALALLAHCHFMRSRYDQALELAASAESKDSKCILALLVQSLVFSSHYHSAENTMGNLDLPPHLEELLSVLDTADLIRTRNAFLLTVAAIAKGLQNESSLHVAIGYADLALKMDPKAILAYQCMAKAHFRLGELELALHDSENAILVMPNTVFGHAERGMILYFLERYDDAVKEFDRTIDIFDQSDSVFNNRGHTHAALKHTELAEADFDKALELNAKNCYSWNGKGHIRYSEKKYGDAARCYGNALEINPRDGAAFTSRGLCYLEIGEDEKALADFDQSVKLCEKFQMSGKPHEDQAVAYNGRARAYVSLGKFREARRDYDKALLLCDYYGEAYYRRGMVELEIGEEGKAAKDFAKAKEHNYEE